MLFDAHCHLDLPAFDDDRQAVIQRAIDAGISSMIVAGYDPDGWHGIIDLTKKYSCIYGVLGLHPWALSQLCEQLGVASVEQRLPEWMRELDQLLTTPKILGLGETGLDRSAGASKAPIDLQEGLLRRQTRLARKHSKPLVIHALRAVEATRKVLESEGAQEVGGMVHSYSGSAQEVGAWTAMGFYLSYGGPITYVGAKKAPAALAATPLDRLLLESDAPDQTPHPHRGSRNEPAYLGHVLQSAAEQVGINEHRLAVICASNTRSLFGLPDLASGSAPLENDLT